MDRRKKLSLALPYKQKFVGRKRIGRKEESMNQLKSYVSDFDCDVIERQRRGIFKRRRNLRYLSRNMRSRRKGWVSIRQENGVVIVLEKLKGRLKLQSEVKAIRYNPKVER